MDTANPFRVSSPMSHLGMKIGLVKEDGAEIVAKSQASGFLWKSESNTYLVTNLHNLSGWDYVRGKAMSTSGFIPDAVHIGIAVGERNRDGQPSTMMRQELRANLSRDGNPLWLIHPTHGTSVDVAVLGLGEIVPAAIWPDDPIAQRLTLVTRPANRIAEWTDFDVDAGDDAYVLGYPLGIDGGKGFPLWKRASIASEPAADIDNLPKALIDTATRSGMSGSPVIAVRRGLITPRGREPGIAADSVIGQAATFFGVYSGRVDDDPLGAQIGIVWKASVIDEIINGGRRGQMPWD